MKFYNDKILTQLETFYDELADLLYVDLPSLTKGEYEKFMEDLSSRQFEFYLPSFGPNTPVEERKNFRNQPYYKHIDSVFRRLDKLTGDEETRRFYQK